MLVDSTNWINQLKKKFGKQFFKEDKNIHNFWPTVNLKIYSKRNPKI